VANQDFYVDLEFFNTDVPPVAEPKWELMADGVSWLGPWEPDYYYKIGDAVRVSGTIYICVEAHTSASTEAEFISQTAFWTIQKQKDRLLGTGWSAGRQPLQKFWPQSSRR
jgi:hypothetical protein